MAEAALPAAELTTSGRPILLPNEIECSLLSNVELEPESSSSIHLRSSFLILTTHRLIFVSDSSSAAASNAATYVPLASITHIFSLKKSIKSMFASPRLKFQLSVGLDGRVGGPGTRSLVLTLVMRGKDDVEAFVDKFRQNWGARAWERRETDRLPRAGAPRSIQWAEDFQKKKKKKWVSQAGGSGSNKERESLSLGSSATSSKYDSR